MKVVPSLLSSSYSVTDERTRVWIDEGEVMSLQSGSSMYLVASIASLQALGDQAEPVVLVDMPDYLLKADVEGLVRQALTAKGVPQADNYPLVAKRLDWTMGNVRLPSWQVSRPSGLARTMLGSMLDISVLGPLGGVQQALVYSMKEYTTARAAWRKDRPGKGSRKGTTKPPAKGGAGEGGDRQHRLRRSTARTLLPWTGRR